jgi:hypothetical protein
MSIDYSSLATNSAALAAILSPLLQYVHRKSQTYFLDLLAIPFGIFLVTTLTSAVNPNLYTVILFIIGVILEIGIYSLLVIEQYYYGKYRLTTTTSPC